MLCKVTHCTGRILTNTRPHQLHWGDWEVGWGDYWEMGTSISCIECSHVAGLMNILEYKNADNLFLLRDLPVVVVNDNCMHDKRRKIPVARWV